MLAINQPLNLIIFILTGGQNWFDWRAKALIQNESFCKLVLQLVENSAWNTIWRLFILNNLHSYIHNRHSWTVFFVSLLHSCQKRSIHIKLPPLFCTLISSFASVIVKVPFLNYNTHIHNFLGLSSFFFHFILARNCAFYLKV